jgi:uncharacterized protein YycO
MIEVYDLECLSNLFTYTGYDYKQDKWFQYVISEWRNDYNELVEHLSKLELQIGFNNLGYDYPLEHHLINHYNEYSTLGGQLLAQNLYSKSQSIIESEFNEIADKNSFIHQMDLFRIWHYNNKARRSS